MLLEILLPLPTELQGKYGYSVYRVHSSTGQDQNKEAQELKQGEANKNELGEYFTVNSDKTQLTLYVKCFSTYAVGYSNAPVTTPPSDNTGDDGQNGGSGSTGGSGGGAVPPAYTPIIAQSEHGSVNISPKNPQRGDLVTMTPTPEQGYVVDTVTVADPTGKPVAVTSNEDGTYTFTQPVGKVTVTVTFRRSDAVEDCPGDATCPITPFIDADPDAWYHDGVHYCLEHGWMVGTSETTFAPETVTTRGMIVTILWRLEGSPTAAHSIDYDDVDQKDWYGEAVRWADSAGVVNGYGNGKFGPNDPITREQLAAMLWRYAGSPHVDGSLSSFVDGVQTSDWAQSAMIWAVDQELIIGVGQNQLASRDQSTRAQSATLLMRFVEKGHSKNDKALR